MTARALGGRALAQGVRETVATRLTRHLDAGGRPPRVVAFTVRPDPAVRAYLDGQARAAAKAGLAWRIEAGDGDESTAQARDRLARLCDDPAVDGVVVAWPMPAGVDGERVLEALDPHKDVDALGPACLGRLAVDRSARAPATARAVMAVLQDGVGELAGRRVTLVGKGRTAGMPTLFLLLHAGAVVEVLHSRAGDLGPRVREADILVSCVGRPGLVRAADVRPGAVVVDVGMAEVEGSLVGDVEPAVADTAAAYTPVPGGVGPVTLALLLDNALAVAGA